MAQNPFPAVVDLDDVARGSGGFKIQGQNAYDGAGVAVSAAGDVNGDGINDLLVGAFRNSSGGVDAGAAYVVFGRSGGFGSIVDLDTVARGIGGFKIQGQDAEDFGGGSVSTAGDVNGDGIDDLLVGALFNDSGGYNAGAAYVVFGRSGGFGSLVDLDTVARGTGGFKIQGQNAGDWAALVSAAGDVNGDGCADLLVGASGNDSGGDRAGAAYVLFGRSGGFGSLVDLDTVAGGTGGYKVQGQNAYDYAGRSISAAGDVNGDGFDDLLAGASGNDSGGVTAGAAYVVFGRSGGFGSLVDLDTVARGTGGFKIQGQNTGDFAGSSVSAAGDVNGDGLADLLVGAFGNDSGGNYAGAAYVVFGRSGGFGSLVDLDTVARGTGGFKIQGHAIDQAGVAVSAAGDVNGDGIADLLVGARWGGSGGNSAGAAYVVFGRSDGFGSLVDLDTVARGTGGFKIQGQNAYDFAGLSVSAAGDVNGDGIDDLLVGAAGNDSGGGYAGAAYVIYGRRSSSEIVGDNGPNLLNGTSGPDVIKGLGGDDRLYGKGGHDQLEGGRGADRLYGEDGADTLLGDGGADWLVGGRGGDVLRGGAERDWLKGDGGADRFVFDDGDSGLGTDVNDEIADFSHAQHDLIDLSRIDADLTRSGDQAFTWIGTAAFTKTGQLHYVQRGLDVFLEGNNDADRAADFSIELNEVAALAKADVIL